MTEVRLPFRGKIVDAEVVFDTDDIDELDVTTHRGFYSGDDGEGHYTRTLNGENVLTLRIRFKPYKHEMFEEIQ